MVRRGDKEGHEERRLGDTPDADAPPNESAVVMFQGGVVRLNRDTAAIVRDPAAGAVGKAWPFTNVIGSQSLRR